MKTGLIHTNSGKFMHTVKLGTGFWLEGRRVKDWCETNCTGEFTIGIAWIQFEKEADAMFFKLSHNTQ